MSGERNAALEAAIEAAPDDAAPYLVYADWLQERGDPRGELISLQAAGTEPLDAFMIDHWADLLGDELALHFGRDHLQWHLGFVREAKIGVVPPGDPRTMLPAQVRDVALSFFKSASGRFVRKLTLDISGLTPDDLRAILSCDPKPTLLTSLTLKDGLTAQLSHDVCSAIVDSPIIGQLEEIDLINCCFVDAAAMVFTAFAKRLKRIQRFEINPTNISEPVLKRWKRVCPAIGTERHAEAFNTAATFALTQAINLLTTIAERNGQTTEGLPPVPPVPESKPYFAPSTTQALSDIELALDRRDGKK